MALAMGWDPSEKVTVPFTPDNLTFMDALQDQVLNPLQNEGVYELALAIAA